MRHTLLIIAAALLSACDSDTTTRADTDVVDAPLLASDGAERDVQDGSLLEIDVRGKGTADVVFIPGLATPRDVWAGTAERLEGTHRLHLVGVRGFGGLAPLPDADDIDGRIVDDLTDYLEGEDLRDVTLVGHSLGGFSALRAALASDRVGRVVVVDALPFYPLVISPEATIESSAAQAAMMAAQMRAVPPDAFARMMRGNAGTMSKTPDAAARIGEWSATSDPATVVDAMEALMTTDIRPRLSGIDVPVHVLVAHDPAMGVERETYLERWRAAYADLPNLTLVPIDDSFHFIMFDQREAFAAALDVALEETLP